MVDAETLRRLRALRNEIAIVGVGETDYAADYEAVRRARERGEAVTDDPDLLAYRLLTTAFSRALADSGLERRDINGLAVHDGQGSTNFERVAELLGLTLTWGGELGYTEHTTQAAVEAIATGRCDTVAIVMGIAPRAAGVTMLFGGAGERQRRILDYTNLWYYEPWGLSGGTPQFAFAAQQYFERFGKAEADLGAIAVTFRGHAQLNENAIMREPLRLEDYLGARYVSRPLRLLDCCLVNDGGACMILTRRDLVQRCQPDPVYIAGIGRHGDYRAHTQMRFRMLEDSWRNIAAAGAQCFSMGGIGPGDVDMFQCYDGYSIHVPVALEGFGFCAPGEGLDFVQDGRIGLGGELPCNTAGGLLSESWMGGLNLQIEAVRQLRASCGGRQVPDARTALYCHHGHWGAVALLYESA